MRLRLAFFSLVLGRLREEDEADSLGNDGRGMDRYTKMGFAGISDPADRADTIAYLRSLAANPAPLPEAPAAEETAAAEGAE